MAKKGKVGRKAAKSPAKIERPVKAGTTPLKVICQEYGLDPKRARVKLRRIWRRAEEPGVQFHAKGERWDLDAKEAREVRTLLAPAQ